MLRLVIGCAAGYHASLLVKGYGLGVPGNIVVCILGSILSGAVLPRLGIQAAVISSVRSSPH